MLQNFISIFIILNNKIPESFCKLYSSFKPYEKLNVVIAIKKPIYNYY